MDIKKQWLCLGLIQSGRYFTNDKGEILSGIGKGIRVLKPMVHYTGYHQYCLDIGYSESIVVYGQGFVYLATYKKTFDPKFVIDHIDKDKGNNRPDNLRCITESENLQGTWRNGPRPYKCRRVRLPEDIKQAIRGEAQTGLSAVKLAKKYKTSRQTIAKICSVK